MSFLFLPLLIGPLLLLPSTSKAAPSDLAELQGRAARANLSQHRTWEVLLHYKPNLWGKTVSLIDDPRFFLAPEGKTDPAQELSLTLENLLTKPSQLPEQQHVRCRFPARSEWLIEQLDIDPAGLPDPGCTDLNVALERIQPLSAVLIFPGNHNNSPASMFGHTLLSIEGPYESRLLSYAVNYGAQTDETNGLSYAVKGIFGFYPGFYSLLPYYAKVREYNDLERRDIWEFELDLTAAEVRRMTLHTWELRNMASEYYFFDENCSYNLLFLIEAARPSLNLTDPCRPWVIPVDTVRIVREAGLIKNVVYRPSKANRIQELARQMDRQETATAHDLLAERIRPTDIASSELTVAQQIRILDVAIETLEFRYYRKEFTQEEYQQRSLELLRARSTLGRAQAQETSEPTNPDLGHGSNRLGLGLGLWDNQWYQELRLRPAYHNLLDADEGYLPGSQIDFANLVLRVFPERHKVELHALNLINIVSLSPRHAFFRPISWKVETGFQQHLFEDQQDHLVYRLNPGGGFTWGSNDAMAYGLMETDLLVGGRFRDSYALGTGGTLGTLLTLTPAWKLHASARHIWYGLGESHRSLQVSLKQNWKLSANRSIAFELSRHHTAGHYATDATLLFNLYW